MPLVVNNYLHCCRVCLDTEKSELFQNIYDSRLQGPDLTVQEALQKTTGIQCPQDDRLPSNICQSCQLRLQDAYNFIVEYCSNSELLESLREQAMEEEKQIQLVRKLIKKDIEEDAYQEEDGFMDESVDAGQSDDKELLKIERLDDASLHHNSQLMCEYLMLDEEDRVADEHDQDPIPDNEFDQETMSTGEEEEEDEELDEDATDAVDFILKNLQHVNKKCARKASQTSERKYQCEVCEKSFLRKSNLVDHLRLHANVKLFACSYCSAAFVQAGNLKSHIRKHTLEKPYKCDYCDKSYSQSSALKTHIRSHTNTRDYICSICTKGFTNSSDMNKHKLTHSNLRFYQCVACHKRYFTQKVHLKKHLRSHHSTHNIDELLQQGTLKEGVPVNNGSGEV